MKIDINDGVVSVPTKTVFVVMRNDFPDSVWSTEERAESYVIRNKGLDTRIHWSVHDYTLHLNVPTALSAEAA